jgi:hypothetical protein
VSLSLESAENLVSFPYEAGTEAPGVGAAYVETGRGGVSLVCQASRQPTVTA